jgi:hypothetical protein|tara:strand:+ start:220 stop:435 length:216 start_codon:yes stop_codon:yes gene_type:complete
MSKIELRKRKFDGKWVRWELKDSHTLNGIGHTATWPRYKWVVTGVWDHKPKISEPSFHAWYEGQPHEEIED